MPPAVVMGAMAAAGGVAGAMKKNSSQTSTSQIFLDPASQRELNAGQVVDRQFSDLQGLVGAGPGMQDVTASLGASRDLADMLKGGIDPTGEDISASNGLAQALMAQQRVSATQGFDEAMRQGNSQAALMGRNPNDPVLRAKLLQNQMNQSAQLDAQQFGLSSQLAMARPGQRISQAANRASVLGGLASQAMANRQAIASMGDSIFQNERNFRLNTATRTNTTNTSSGGGVGGAISGALGGMGAGMSFASGMGALGLGGGGGGGDYSGNVTATGDVYTRKMANIFGQNPNASAGPGYWGMGPVGGGP